MWDNVGKQASKQAITIGLRIALNCFWLSL